MEQRYTGYEWMKDQELLREAEYSEHNLAIELAKRLLVWQKKYREAIAWTES